MAVPLATDLRERVAAADLGGERCRLAPAPFGVSVPLAAKRSRACRETREGHLRAIAIGEGPIEALRRLSRALPSSRKPGRK